MGSKDPEEHKILWAPWRIEYIENCHQKKDGCIFCDKPAANNDKANLIVHRLSDAYIIMNRYPYNNGHLMIVPFRHTCELKSLTDNEIMEMFQLIEISQDILNEVMKPQGFNIGMNLGQIAGAGIADHLHFHIVPRWGGDTNFMPVIGKTKVVSEALEQTWEKLKKAIEKKVV